MLIQYNQHQQYFNLINITVFELFYIMICEVASNLRLFDLSKYTTVYIVNNNNSLYAYSQVSGDYQ